MVPVPVMVRLVWLPAFHPLVPATVHVPEPIAMVLILLFADVNPEDPPDSVTLYTFALNVPDNILIAVLVSDVVVYASCSVTEPPGVSIAIG